MADWKWLLRNAERGQERRGVPYLETETVKVPCELVLTGKKGSNGKILVVRCRCQAQTRVEPAAHYYAYDPLGEATSIPEAVRLWREHVEAKPTSDTQT